MEAGGLRGWLKILWEMWQTRQCYDPKLPARNQLKHASWILKLQNASPHHLSYENRSGISSFRSQTQRTATYLV